MNNLIEINLTELVARKGEDKVKNLLSTFSCPLNNDVEHFIKYTAIEFSKQGISSTYLVFAKTNNGSSLVGYYTLANKIFFASADGLPSKTWRRRFEKFGYYDSMAHHYCLSAPLIGQLGKNYTSGFNKYISGDELLELAIEKIKVMQYIVGGKIVYLECEPKPSLISFYTRNGFTNFGKRYLDSDEILPFEKEQYLIQMLKYIH